MSDTTIRTKIGQETRYWQPPVIAQPAGIPTGDMPGDKVSIGGKHIAKAQSIFPALMAQLVPLLGERAPAKAVVSVHGGSGVGKSEIGSLLAYYLNDLGVGAYILSGDNYPHRIPADNDRERLLVFREYAMKGLVAAGGYTKERNAELRQLQSQDQDANPAHCRERPWLAPYQTAGRKALAEYLGTSKEIDFAEVNQIIGRFKAGEPSLMLKRMGRTDAELWYERIDMGGVQVLVIEWTHGNNDNLVGVDIPILLNSTPQETLEHRRSRNRDGAVDSPFTTMVLEIEQGLLASQAHKAKLIVSKSGEIINYEQFTRLMAEGGQS